MWDMDRAALETEAKRLGAEGIDSMIEQTPMGRMASADELSAMVAWMCSEECSFTTGGVFDISGGRATY